MAGRLPDAGSGFCAIFLIERMTSRYQLFSQIEYFLNQDV